MPNINEVKEALAAITEKSKVLEYAAQLNIEGLIKQRNIDRLKADIIEALEAREQPVQEEAPAPVAEEVVAPVEESKPDLLSSLAQETEAQAPLTSKPVKGGQAIQIVKDGVVEEIAPESLEAWCVEHHQQVSAVKSAMDKTWVNHNGYTFKYVNH